MQVISHTYYSSPSQKVSRIDELRDMIAETVVKATVNHSNVERVGDLTRLGHVSTAWNHSVGRGIAREFPLRIVEKKIARAQSTVNIYTMKILDGRFWEGIPLSEWNFQFRRPRASHGQECKLEVHIITEVDVLGAIFEGVFRPKILRDPLKRVLACNVSSLVVEIKSCYPSSC